MDLELSNALIINCNSFRLKNGELNDSLLNSSMYKVFESYFCNWYRIPSDFPEDLIDEVLKLLESKNIIIDISSSERYDILKSRSNIFYFQFKPNDEYMFYLFEEKIKNNKIFGTEFFDDTSILWDFYFLNINFIYSILTGDIIDSINLLRKINKPVIGYNPFYPFISNKELTIKENLYIKVYTFLYPFLSLRDNISYSVTIETLEEFQELESIMWDLKNGTYEKDEYKEKFESALERAKKYYPIGALDYCLYCKKCNQACPLGLFPEEMMIYFRRSAGGNFKPFKSEIEKTAAECNFCGECNKVCPANFPLSEYMKGTVRRRDFE